MLWLWGLWCADTVTHVSFPNQSLDSFGIRWISRLYTMRQRHGEEGGQGWHWSRQESSGLCVWGEAAKCHWRTPLGWSLAAIAALWFSGCNNFLQAWEERTFNGGFPIPAALPAQSIHKSWVSPHHLPPNYNADRKNCIFVSNRNKRNMLVLHSLFKLAFELELLCCVWLVYLSSVLLCLQFCSCRTHADCWHLIQRN